MKENSSVVRNHYSKRILLNVVISEHRIILYTNFDERKEVYTNSTT